VNRGSAGKHSFNHKDDGGKEKGDKVDLKDLFAYYHVSVWRVEGDDETTRKVSFNWQGTLLLLLYAPFGICLMLFRWFATLLILLFIVAMPSKYILIENDEVEFE